MIALGVGLFVVGAAAGGLSVYYFIKYKKDNETPAPPTAAPPPTAHPRPAPALSQSFMGTPQQLAAQTSGNEPTQGSRNDSNPDESL